MPGAGLPAPLSRSFRGQPETAARLLGAVDASRNGWAGSAYDRRAFHAAYDPAVAATQAALSTAAYSTAWAEGQAISLGQATELALAPLPSPAADAQPGNPAVSS